MRKVESLLEELIKAMKAQTEAITALVESNQQLIQAMAEGEDVLPEPTKYLDGRPRT